MTAETEKYLEEIIGTLDFTLLNDFLNGHMRMQMTFEELVAMVSANGLTALTKENITKFVFDSVFYELSVIRPIFIKIFCIYLML